MSDEKIISVCFFKSSLGAEPVREWLKKLSKEDKKIIGEDIKLVEISWPVGYPLVTKIDQNLWEVRTVLHDRICRVFFTVLPGRMILLHGIIKKTQKTPKQDLETALKRRDIVIKRRIIQ